MRTLARRKSRVLPQPVAKLAPLNFGSELDPQEVNRAIDAVASAVETLGNGALAGAALSIDVDLKIGTNRVGHGLGHPVSGLIAMPRDAGGAMPGFDPEQPGNPNPKRQVWLTSTVAGRYRLVLF